MTPPGPEGPRAAYTHVFINVTLPDMDNVGIWDYSRGGAPRKGINEAGQVNRTAAYGRDVAADLGDVDHNACFRLSAEGRQTQRRHDRQLAWSCGLSPHRDGAAPRTARG